MENLVGILFYAFAVACGWALCKFITNGKSKGSDNGVDYLRLDEETYLNVNHNTGEITITNREDVKTIGNFKKITL